MKSSSSLLSAITGTTTTTTTTLYQLLRVKQTASQAEIKAAYRGLAKQYHPDAMSSSNPNGQDFIEIHEAYAILSNPIARARYDLSIGVTTTTAARRGYRYTAAGFPTPTRRWETDQCWQILQRKTLRVAWLRQIKVQRNESFPPLCFFFFLFFFFFLIHFPPGHCFSCSAIKADRQSKCQNVSLLKISCWVSVNHFPQYMRPKTFFFLRSLCIDMMEHGIRPLFQASLQVIIKESTLLQQLFEL